MTNKTTKSEPTVRVWPPGMTYDEVKKRVCHEALEHHGGNRTHTAATLMVSIRTIRNWIRKYGES